MPGSLTEVATEHLLHPRRRLLDDPIRVPDADFGSRQNNPGAGRAAGGVDRALSALRASGPSDNDGNAATEHAVAELKGVRVARLVGLCPMRSRGCG
jgi:hypothetical protein